MLLTRRQFATGLAATGATAALPGCVATNPATGRTSFTGFYSIEDDIRLGRQEHPKLVEAFGGRYDDPALQAYVDRIGKRLAEHAEFQQFPYSFTILNSPIVNAFALPGGYVHISRGLLALADNEAEMAGVLAHELGHVTARHTAERLSSAMLAQVGLLALGVATGSGQLVEAAQYGAAAYIQGFSRDQEFEADSIAVRYMSRADYDPDAMVSFLTTLREHSMLDAKMLGLPPGKVDEFNIMSTHPRTTDRVRAAVELASAMRPADPVRGRDEYLARISGMLFGDDPEQGIVFGHQFIHPALRFRFEVPDGFRLLNSPEQVVARRGDGATILFDMGVTRQSRTMAAYLREWVPNLQMRDVEPLDVNGIEAGTGWNRINTSQGQMDVRLVALRGDDAQVFRMAFLTPPAATAALAPELRRATYSFRRLSAEEAADIRPLRLIAVDLRPGDTIRTLSGGMPFAAHNEEAFRIFNGLRPGEPLPSTGKAKIVTT